MKSIANFRVFAFSPFSPPFLKNWLHVFAKYCFVEKSVKSNDTGWQWRRRREFYEIEVTPMSLIFALQ